MKSYCKYIDVLLKLRNIISENISHSNLLLAGERELSLKTGASRMTIRKALIELEKENIVYRDKNLTKINPPSRKKGKFVFIAAGRTDSGTFNFYAYESLWMHISKLAEASGLDLQLFMLTTNEEYFKNGIAPEILKGADGIFISLVDRDKYDVFLRSLNSITPNVFAVDMMLEKYYSNMIALDNFAVGEMAAEAIIKHGYKKAACIIHHKSYIPFVLRASGFEARMKKAGVQYIVISENKHLPEEYPERLKNHIKKLMNDGCDSIFFITDEGLNFILPGAIRDDMVPSKFGVVTFDGSNTGLRMLPSLTCVSNAARPMASAIIDTMNKIVLKKFKAPLKLLIKPELYDGESLK